jgi:hypothetical protein
MGVHLFGCQYCGQLFESRVTVENHYPVCKISDGRRLLKDIEWLNEVVVDLQRRLDNWSIKISKKQNPLHHLY